MTPEDNRPEHSATVARSEIAALKNQIFTLLMALVVVSGTLTIYLYRQSRLAGADLVQAHKLDAAVTHNEAALQDFVSKLEAYGQQHPDFQQILKKYGIQQQSAVKPAATPATSAAPATPKK